MVGKFTVSRAGKRLGMKMSFYRKQNKKKVTKPQVKAIINRALQGDKNIFYATISDDVVPVGTGGGTVLCLNAMAVGTGEGQRVSNSQTNLALDLSYRLSGDDVSTDGQTSPVPKVRVIIFNQKISITGALLTTPTLLFSNLAQADGTNMLHEPLPQWNARTQFKMLYDRVHTLGTVGVNESTTTAGVLVPDSWVIAETGCIRVRRNLKQSRTTYTGATAAGANTNILYIAFLPQTGTGFVSCLSRLIFME